jgi:hypothetical protein
LATDGFRAEDKPHGTPDFRPKATKSARGSSARVQTEPRKGTTDHDSHSRLAETEATLTAEPNLLPFALMQMDNPIDVPQMPPSPPLTATSSMSRAGFVPRVFDSLTQDQWGSRTFFVACQGTGAIEYYIKVRKPVPPQQQTNGRQMVGCWMSRKKPHSSLSTHRSRVYGL